MSNFRKYLWIARISAQSNLSYTGDLVGRIVFLATVLFIFLQLWRTTFGQTGSVQLGGLTLTQMLWYLTITEAILMSGPKVAQQTDEDVRTGALAMQLVRPMSYGWYRLATAMGERYLRFAVNLLATACVTFCLVGPLPSAAGGLILLAVSLPLAFLLDFLGNFWVGLAAFWLEDTNGLLLIYSRGVLIIGGSFIPLDLYPPVVQPFLRWLPFANITGGPAHLFVDPNAGDLLALLVRQLAGAVVLGVVALVTYRAALQRVFVNGG
jgi:ABC-2 type transport system permease protein